jgi:hypothetical protein
MTINTDLLFPIIENNSDFIKTHPNLHPSSSAYEVYWTEELTRLIYGYWGKEETKQGIRYRFIPPQLYYFINYHTMMVTVKKQRIKSKPFLWDINYTIMNLWFIARGFSGFKDDPNYTSNYTVYLKEQKLKYPNNADIPLHLLETLTEDCYKENGTLKEYIDPLEYLNSTHKEPLGIPLYDNYSTNLFLFGSRGGGKSFMASAILEHEYLTDGAKSMEDFLAKRNKVEIFCGAPIASKSADLLDKFKDSLDNLPGEYSNGREMFPPPFSRQSSGTLKVGNSKNPYRFHYEKKIGNTTKVVGTGTLLKHETFKENKQAAVGGRYTVIVIEEVGLEDSLLTIHGANRSTQDLGTGKFGSSLYIGTSGDVDKVIETEIIFRDPEAYDFLSFNDIYEGRNKIGFFLPAYYTNEMFKDKNGNTNIEKALEYEYYEREKAKKANNTVAYDELIMSRPIKPSEMFLSRTGNKFPIAMLREVQANNDKYQYKKHLRTIGNLIPDKDYIFGVKFRADPDLRPIDRFPHDQKSNLQSAWEFYEHPPAGLIPTNLYKIIYDPIKDEGGGTSLAAIYVYKSNNTIDNNGNELVAWWVGRYDMPEDIHLQCVLAAKYFNAQVMFENNIIDFKNYCMRTGNYHILAPTPKQIIEKAVKDPTMKYDVGVPMTNPLKQYALRLSQQWLLEEKKKYVEELIDGTNREIIVRNLDTIKDDLLLEELIQYNDKGNFDRVSAFLLLMLWIEQDKELVIKETENIVKKSSLDFYQELHNNRLKNKLLINY